MGAMFGCVVLAMLIGIPYTLYLYWVHTLEQKKQKELQQWADAVKRRNGS